MRENIKREYYKNTELRILFKCGCVLTKDEIVKGKYAKRYCPTHQQTIDRDNYYCNECGNIFPEKEGKPVKSGRRRYCNICRKKKKTQASYRYEDKVAFEIAQGIRPKRTFLKKKVRREDINYETKPDCKYYVSKCLIEVCRDKLAKAVDCRDCKRYEKESLDIMDFVKTNDGYYTNLLNVDL